MAREIRDALFGLLLKSQTTGGVKNTRHKVAL
jgi:hypothetical protein